MDRKDVERSECKEGRKKTKNRKKEGEAGPLLLRARNVDSLYKWREEREGSGWRGRERGTHTAMCGRGEMERRREVGGLCLAPPPLNRRTYPFPSVWFISPHSEGARGSMCVEEGGGVYWQIWEEKGQIQGLFHGNGKSVPFI